MTAADARLRPGARVGVDVGNARVGVAASGAAGALAHPVRTLPRDAKDDTDVDAIVELVRELEAIEVVVGLPRLLSGEEGEAARIARDYAGRLAARLGSVVVRMVDERLTTVDAHRRLRDSGVPGRGQRAVVDQAAAVLILQSALDTEALSGRPPGEIIMPGGKRKKERRR
ncbi:MAG TPA: Holliday junction resolvase RuvX [Terrabacter sp.]|nr:Holliday junction resolvase RuvX [Terrabacter sp.]